MVIRICLIILISLAQVEAAQFASGDNRVSLIELYTSEGCSSCPPADRWLTTLKKEKGLWRDFIPVAFHVDYWDYIGWKDRFSSAQYSQRQRRYAAENGEASVYTPGVRKNGREWRAWRTIEGSGNSNTDSVGNLAIEIDEDGAFSSTFSYRHSYQNGTAESLILTIALLGLDLDSMVTRGENLGKLLSHDFVVLGLITLGSNLIETSSISTVHEWKGALPKPSLKAPKYAIAAWVTEGHSLMPIQVVGGPFSFTRTH